MKVAMSLPPSGLSFQHSDFGGVHTIGADPRTRIRYTITQDTMFVDMWEVAPGRRNQGVGRELFREALAAHPHITSIRGIAELDNLAVLRRTGNVAQTVAVGSALAGVPPRSSGSVEQETHLVTPPRPTSEVPIIGFSALLQLVEWCHVSPNP
jgi:hypothetical protein